MRNKKLITIFIVICVFALFIILGSVIFSVSRVEVYCYNYDSSEIVNDTSMEDEVLGLVENSIRGKSIFLINDEEITEKVNSLGYVYVINVERKFPNIVYINVVRRFKYIQIKTDEGYALLDRDGFVTEFSAEKLPSEEIIDVTLSGTDAKDFVVGKKPSLPNNDLNNLVEIITTLEKLSYTHFSASALVKHIDLSKGSDNIYIETQAGVVIKLIGTSSIESKLQLAVSFLTENYERRHDGQADVYFNEMENRFEIAWNEKTDYYSS